MSREICYFVVVKCMIVGVLIILAKQLTDCINGLTFPM
jgi:hypothetical protein